MSVRYVRAGPVSKGRRLDLNRVLVTLEEVVGESAPVAWPLLATALVDTDRSWLILDHQSAAAQVWIEQQRSALIHVQLQPATAH